MGADSDDHRAMAALAAELLALGYPWPENLEGQSREWLEAEIRAIKPAQSGKPDND